MKLYYHAGSLNHGCEAIVRATQKIIGGKQILYTQNMEADLKYGLDECVSIKCENAEYALNKKERICAAISFKIRHTDYLYYKYLRKNFFSEVNRDDVYLSIGGDNYCYAGKDVLGYYNLIIHEKKAKTVLWGCSFEPKDMNESIARDIARYDAIFARESLSYDILKRVNPDTYLFPDPAFQLDLINLPLPENFKENNTVGINVSPLIMKSEPEEGITKRNYQNLIDYIVKNTDFNIALIPHVVEVGNDDREPLESLYQQFSKTERVCLINDRNCMELKGFIARCRFFVGARTHATIAAYSSCIPTLVVGYSIKAKGIAKDIFGTYKNYVLPVQSLEEDDDLINSFQWLMKNEKLIKNHLIKIMPEYKERSMRAGKKLRSLFND